MDPVIVARLLVIGFVVGALLIATAVLILHARSRRAPRARYRRLGAEERRPDAVRPRVPRSLREAHVPHRVP